MVITHSFRHWQAYFLIVLLSCLSVAAQAEILKIYHIDVEQGDATLFITPSGNTLLVDSGKNGHGARIKAIMDQEGITQIDHFVATHYHEDHYGGIDDLINDQNVTVVNAYDRGDKNHIPTKKKKQTTYSGYHTAVGSRATTLRQGQSITLDPLLLQILCIASGGAVLNENPHVSGNDENDMSIALLVQFGSFRYFIGGDIENTTEGKIAERDLAIDVDAYQANHHGSNTSSSLTFMQDLKPTVIIISNGNNAKYRHPRQFTLNTYANLQPQPVVYQTNKYTKGGSGGNVDDVFIADPESSDTDGTILMTVDSTTNRYTITYGSTSHSYPIKSRTIATGQVVIESLLPNPSGPDVENESVTILNKSNASVSMTGWTLNDASGRVWSLSGIGQIPAQQSITIQRNRMAMSLNNHGDTISLIDDTGQLRDQFQYPQSQENIAIPSGH